jgi:hypothetical protein
VIYVRVINKCPEMEHESSDRVLHITGHGDCRAPDMAAFGI